MRMLVSHHLFYKPRKCKTVTSICRVTIFFVCFRCLWSQLSRIEMTSYTVHHRHVENMSIDGLTWFQRQQKWSELLITLRNSLGTYSIWLSGQGYRHKEQEIGLQFLNHVYYFPLNFLSLYAYIFLKIQHYCLIQNIQIFRMKLTPDFYY